MTIDEWLFYEILHNLLIVEGVFYDHKNNESFIADLKLRFLRNFLMAHASIKYF